MRVHYRPNSILYDNYYKNQVGHGLPVYVGGMKGRGLGSVLSGLLRTAVPLLKKGRKALLKEGVRSGLGVAQDILSGKNIKSALKGRAKGGGKRLLNKAIGQFNAPAPPGEPAFKHIKKSVRIKKKSKRSKDIFG